LETNNPAVVYASLMIAIYYFIDNFVVGIAFFSGTDFQGEASSLKLISTYKQTLVILSSTSKHTSHSTSSSSASSNSSCSSSNI
jgi:hypothetical protein